MYCHAQYVDKNIVVLINAVILALAVFFCNVSYTVRISFLLFFVILPRIYIFIIMDVLFFQ